MNRLKRGIIKASDIIADIRFFAFLVPFLTIIAVFAFLQVYPVGDRTVLTVDLYHQYMPFIYEFRAKLLGGRSLFYSWNSGLGNEYYAAFANYAASPLNYLCIFFPYKALPVFVAFVTALRAGLASLFMSIFLASEDYKRYDLITGAFSATYALSGWFLTDFWNIMWCDAFVLLPLICYGLKKLMAERKYGLYVITLAMCIISNYYAGYFICLFLVMYSVVLYFTMEDMERNVVTFFKSAGRFALASATAGLISAFVVLPTYIILQHSSATGDVFPKDFNLTNDLFDFIGRLMVSANPNIRDGMANVACGVVVALMIPLFFVAPKNTMISLRHKVGYGILFTVMYLSFTNRMLNFIWHGFHFPNQIPFRQSFIMSFLMVTAAYLVIRSLRSYEKKTIMTVIAGAFFFLVLYEKIGEGAEGYQQIGLTLVFLLVQGLVIRFIKMAPREKLHLCEIILAATMVVESFVASIFTIGLVAEHESFTNYDFYGKNRDIINDYVVNIEGTNGHRTFERSEIYPNNICDIQSVYDVKGMSIFSSTARESFVKYMRNFGFHNNGINGLRNPGLTRVTSSLLGIRNFVLIENTSKYPHIFDEEYRSDEVVVFGNPDALALGYVVDDDVINYVPVENNHDCFNKTNDWVRSMGINDDMYLPARAVSMHEENVTYSGNVGNHLTYTVRDVNSAAVFKFSVSASEIGTDVYVYVDSSKSGNINVEGGVEIPFSYDTRSYQMVCLGKYTGEPIEVTMTYSTPQAGELHVYTYELNKAGYEKMIDTFSKNSLEVTYYDDTTIKGTVSTDVDGFLLLTIPYSEGFTVTVDGQEVELVSVQDALSGIYLTKGNHNVIIEYSPKGFVGSIIVTIVGIAMFMIELAVVRFTTHKEELVVASDSEGEQEAQDGSQEESEPETEQ
ncbi:MAG: YfhO family protein [Saccharofermentans sp.]|nr:YfhO family protein [Saccharofermentans sp.]